MTTISDTAGAAAGIFVFIDSRVANWQALAEALPPGSEWRLVDGGSDGLSQVAAALAGRSGVGAVHIVSHGMEGSIQFGASNLSAGTLQAHAGALAAIGAALADGGDILLYGCDAGAGSAGAALVETLAALSGAEVAASTDTTGDAALGGNWLLERSVGQIDAPTLGFATWGGTLGTALTFDFESNVSGAVGLDPAGASSPVFRQTVNGHVLKVTVDTGARLVQSTEADVIGSDPDLDGKVLATDATNIDLPLTKSLTLELEGGKVFDLQAFSLLDSYGTLSTVKITTNRGSFTVNLDLDGTATRVSLLGNSLAQQVTSVTLSDPDSGEDLVISLDNIVIANIGGAPLQPGAPDLDSGSDSGTSNTDNVTNATSLAFLGTSAVGDSSSTVTVFIDQNNDGDYDFGEVFDTASVSNGSWSVDGVPVAALNGTYNAYAFLTSSSGSMTSALSPALQVKIDHSAPTTTFSNILFSNDTGTSGTDRNTSAAAQTITATLSAALAAGDKLEGSLDNGNTWTDLTAKVGGTSLTWTGATLVAVGGLRLRVVDEAGNAGTTTSVAYTLDQTAPTTTVVSALFSQDSGNDFILNTANQALSGTLSANLAAGEQVEVSLNNGASWTPANATAGSPGWSITGLTLTASNTLQVRVKDAAGNLGTALTHAYVFDQTVPTASMPASTELLAPSGASFTVAVTYADTGGAGIDTATFGTGNIGVTGPGNTNLTVTGFSVSGNVVTYTVAAPGGSWDPLDAGQYTVAIKAGSVRDLAGNAVAANASAGMVEVAYSSAPAVSGLRLSADSGTDGADFITNVAAQTVGATLSRALAPGEVVEVSLDNGATWTVITDKVSGAEVAWDGVTLPAAGTIVIRAVDGNGLSGTHASHAYTLDTAVPAQSVLSAALAADSGTVGDFVTNVASQSISGSLDAPLTARDFVEVSLDHGATWVTAAASGSTWSLNGFTLPDAGTLQVRVADTAGNHGAAWTHAYRLDTAAPTAGTPVRADMLDPSGSSFSFTVSYADSGAGIDGATIGTGNVSVTGPAGALTVTGASASGNTVTYTVAAPGGAWDPLDAGAYTIGINAQVRDLAGNTMAANAGAGSFDVGFSAPAVSALRLSADSGTSSTDFVTRVGAQTIGATLARHLIAGEVVQGSLDNGATWTDITNKVGGTTVAWDGVTLPTAGTIVIRVVDGKGAAGPSASQPYVLDQAAPTASIPAGTQLTAPSGASFTVAVTYADTGGAGIDAATYGAGNIGVTGPGNMNLAVTGFSVSGNVVTYTVAAPGGSWDPLDAGSYTVAINANSVHDLAGNAVAADAGAAGIAVVFSSAPAVHGLRLSADNGTSNSDFLTNVGAQTIEATLSRGLAAGEVVYGSLDNGASWTDITAGVSGAAVAWSGVTLPSGGTIVIKVEDGNGLSGAPASHAYLVDTGMPAQSVVSAALSADSALAGDFVTNIAVQGLSGALDAPLGAGEFVEVSLDGGSSWTAASTSGSSWSLAGLTLPAGGTMQVRVSDTAGNHGEPWTHAYLVDTAAPTAGTPVRANLVDPSGSSFTFTVTYADGGAGIDAATIGTGNVSVTGAGGPLTVTGAAASGNTVTYTVAAPGGAWDPIDAGAYTIGINAGVKDLAGNTVAAAPSAHSFTVGVNSAPVLGGVFATPSIDDEASATPFAGVTVSDADADAITLTISYTAANGTLSGAGLAGSAGSYTLSGSAADVQAALRSLVFTPAENQSSGAAVVTTFTLAADDGKATTGNSATVVTTAPVAPTATILLSDTALRAGGTATLTVTFSEAVSGFTAADLSIPGATLGALASGDGGRSWSATVTPAPGVALAAHQVLLDLAGVVDAGGLAGSGSLSGPNYTVGTVRPTATVSIADQTLTAGETTTLTVTFSEAVSGFTVADLTLANGTLSNLASLDGGVTWTATLNPAANAWADANTVRLDLGGVANAAGNAGTGVVLSNPFAVHTGAPPVSEPAPVPVSTVDGVQVAVGRQVDPGTGLVNKVTTVPVVTGTRADDPATPNAALADIPLTASGGGTASTLLVGLPVGVGLQASAPEGLLTNSQALLDLIRRIEQKTTIGSATRQEMTGEGESFLEDLAGGAMLHTATLTPTAAAGGARDIVISGGTAGANLAIGLVIDATQLAGDTTLQLHNVDFAAVVGAATLRGGTGANIVVGDAASQNIFLGEGDDQLYGGGGNDFIGSAGGADLLDGGSGNDLLAGGIGNDTLAGGEGNDVLQGGRSATGAWQFTLAADGKLGAIHQDAHFVAGGRETLALAELDRGAADLAFLSAARATLTDMALLYQAAFDRTPDLAGLNFFLSHGDTAGSVARAIVSSTEWAGGSLGGLSDAAFVSQLYRQVLGREGESAGQSFWTGKLAGASGPALSRAEVLVGFALSAEHRGLHADGIVVAAATVSAENRWIAGSGDDRLEGGAGSDLLVGGDGTDTVVYAGKLADYRLVLGTDGSVQVADKANADVDTLLGIERGAFGDGNIDLSFTQAGATRLETIGLLYQAVLDRAGDLAGFASWAKTGLDTAGFAAGFVGSAEFQARYGTMSDADFVAALYANSSLDASAAGGSAAWVSMLQKHTRAELIGSWIAQDAVQDAHFGIQGLWLV